MANRPYRGEYRAPDNGAGVSRGETEDLATVPIHWAMGGGVPSDVIWTTSAHPLIVHGRVIDLFRANGFTGWSTYAVEVYAKDERVIPDYYGLTITGRCARQDLSRSSILLVQMPGGWVPRFHGHYFDPASWDGSDLFMEAPDQLGKVSMWRCVTERVWRVLRQAKVGNLLFQRLPDVSVSTSVYDGLRHLLPVDFKDRLATAYAEAGVPRPKWVK